MKPRDFLNQFKTKTGGLILFGAVLAAALTVFSVVRKRHIPADEAIPVTPLATNTAASTLVPFSDSPAAAATKFFRVSQLPNP